MPIENMGGNERERLARLEAKVDNHGELLAEIKDALSRLVEVTAESRDNREWIKKNDARLDALEDELTRLDSWMKARWWALVAIVGAVQVLINIATRFLL